MKLAKKPTAINDTDDLLQELLARLEAIEKPRIGLNDVDYEKVTKKSRDYLRGKGKVV